MQKPKFLPITVRVSGIKLHQFLNAIVERAYQKGFDDSQEKKRRDPPTVSEQTIRRMNDVSNRQPPQ